MKKRFFNSVDQQKKKDLGIQISNIINNIESHKQFFYHIWFKFFHYIFLFLKSQIVYKTDSL